MTNENDTKTVPWNLRTWWADKMEQSAKEWVHYRTFFWVSVPMAIIIVTYLATRASDGRASLYEQLGVFLLSGVACGTFGFLVGRRHPDYKRYWSAADILWVGLALWGLLKTLQPIDDYLRQGEHETDAVIVDVNYKGVFRTIAAAEKKHCFGKAEVANVCEDLHDIRQELVLRPGSGEFKTIDDAFMRLSQQSSIDVATGADDWGKYKTAVIAQEQRRSEDRKGSLYFIVQYAYIAALLVAFGLRMARAGSDWHKSGREKTAG